MTSGCSDGIADKGRSNDDIKGGERDAGHGVQDGSMDEALRAVLNEDATESVK